MSTDKKVEAIRSFLTGMAEIRLAVKEDAKAMLAAMPADILMDEEALADFMEEMSEELSRKYLVDANGKIPAKTARLILQYSSELSERDDD
jgi:hypothetical protein